MPFDHVKNTINVTTAGNKVEVKREATLSDLSALHEMQNEIRANLLNGLLPNEQIKFAAYKQPLGGVTATIKIDGKLVSATADSVSGLARALGEKIAIEVIESAINNDGEALEVLRSLTQETESNT